MLGVIEGLNGSGKTFMVMHQIAYVLEQSTKVVGTNMGSEIILGELNELLAKRAKARGEDAPDIHERLMIFPKAETPDYFRHRSGGLVLPGIQEKDPWGARLQKADFLVQMKDYYMPMLEKAEYGLGVCYFLDECQDYFNAREWAETGRGVLWHTGKHRHLDDDVWWITPSAAEIDAGLRRKAHQWWRMQNRYQMKFKGFKMPGKFVCEKFYGEPGPRSVPFETVDLRMGDGFEKTYHTTNALGVRTKPETSALRQKGPPFWMMVVGLICVGLAVMVGLYKVPHLVGRGIGKGLSSFSGALTSSTGLTDGKGPEPVVVSPGDGAAVAGSVRVEAVLVADGEIVVDGRDLARIDGEWQPVVAHSQSGVMVLSDGRRAKLKKAHVVTTVLQPNLTVPGTFGQKINFQGGSGE